MKLLRHKILTCLLLLTLAASAAEPVSFVSKAVMRRDTIATRVYFPQGKYRLDRNFSGNGEALDSLVSAIHQLEKDSTVTIDCLAGRATVSPEGNDTINARLSRGRARVLTQYLSTTLPELSPRIDIRAAGIDWTGLRALAAADPRLPHKGEVLAILDGITPESRAAAVKMRLGRIAQQRSWDYMYEHYFPSLRNSAVIFCIYTHPVYFTRIPTIPIGKLAIPPTTITPSPCGEGWGGAPWHFALTTNLLYDALAIPNIGIEIPLGKHWSASADWMYAWWKHDMKALYWRIYGGQAGVRYWPTRPFEGHHFGLRGGVFAYDFCLGGRGYMGGVPGGTLWQRPQYHASVEYGYSIVLNRRLRLDLNLSLGYSGGEYREYLPIEGHYVWQVTKQRRYVGPTGASVGLVWLIGPGAKGGKR